MTEQDKKTNAPMQEGKTDRQYWLVITTVLTLGLLLISVVLFLLNEIFGKDTFLHDIFGATFSASLIGYLIILYYGMFKPKTSYAGKKEQIQEINKITKRIFYISLLITVWISILLERQLQWGMIKSILVILGFLILCVWLPIYLLVRFRK